MSDGPGTGHQTRTSRANPTVRKAAVAQRRAEILRLKLAGMSTPQVAERLGVREATIRQDVHQALAAYEKDLAELVPQMRAQQAARLEMLFRPFFDTATDPESNPLDRRDSALVALRIMEREAKLLGLDATQPFAMNVNVTPVAITVDNARDRVLEIVRGQTGPGQIAAGGQQHPEPERRPARDLVGSVLEAELTDTEAQARAEPG